MSSKRKSRSRGGGTPSSTNSRKRPSSATRIDLASGYHTDSSASAAAAAHGDDDHIHSDDELSGQEMDYRKGESEEESSDEEAKETVDAKRIRLARQYLTSMERKVGRKAGTMDSTSEESGDESSSSDDDEDDDDNVARMGPSPHGEDKLGAALARSRKKREGTLYRQLALRTRKSIASLWDGQTAAATTAQDPLDDFRSFTSSGDVTLHRGHDLTATAVALHQSGSTAYSGSKDNSICVWDVERGVRTAMMCPQFTKGNDESGKPRHRADGEVLALAASDDGRYLASGQRDATVKIYDVRMAGQGASSGSGAIVSTFRGHKGPVTSLTFRPGTLQLFSASDDRCLRHHNLEEMAYIETLYGHQAGVTAVACSRHRDRPLSAGRDRTVRSWKLAEETHLIYRPGGKVSSADCVGVVDDRWFLSGHDDGHLSLWMVDKKRPVDTVEAAHGYADGSDQAQLNPRGITSMDVLASSDVAVTGSSDGYARFWNVKTDNFDNGNEERGLESLGRVPLHGYVNGLALGPRARFCVAAIGQEPRLGRWDRVPKAKNRFAIVRLRKEDDEDDGEVGMDGVEEDFDEEEAAEMAEEVDGESSEDDSESDGSSAS